MDDVKPKKEKKWYPVLVDKATYEELDKRKQATGVTIVSQLRKLVLEGAEKKEDPIEPPDKGDIDGRE